MIQPQTIVNVADNSGAKIAKCIKTLKKSRYNYARIGDIIVVAIRKAKAKKKVKQGQVKHGMIIRTKKPVQRKDGSSIQFGDNAVVLISYDNKKEIIPIGTRIFGPVARELRVEKYMKVISLASHLV